MSFLLMVVRLFCFFSKKKNYSYQQILHYHMEQNEYGHVIDTCKKYG